MPRDRGAPVVPGNHRLRDAKRVDQADHVADHVEQCVAVDLWWGVGLTVATHIGRDRMKTSRRQGAQLMPPGIPAFGKAVAQQDRRPGPLLGNVHADAVGLDHVVRCLDHCLLPRVHVRYEPPLTCNV